MSELKLFYKDEGKIKMSRNIELLKAIPLSRFIWIDLNDVAGQVEDQREEFLKIYIEEEEEIAEEKIIKEEIIITILIIVIISITIT